MREKGQGGEGGGGVGTAKGTGKSMRKLCRNYPLAIYALVPPGFLSGLPELLQCLDGPICVNRFRVPELNPFVGDRVSGH